MASGSCGFRATRNIWRALRAELNLLQTFAPLSPLPVPNYEFVAPDKSFGAYRRIRGREMTPAVFAAMPPQNRRSALERFVRISFGAARFAGGTPSRSRTA